MEQDERVRLTSPTQDRSTGSEYFPSPSQSSPESERTQLLRSRQLQHRPTKPPLLQKRAHAATPDERHTEADRVVNVHNRAMPLKKMNNDETTKYLLAEFDEAAQSSNLPESQSNIRGQLPRWPLYWNALASVWQQQTKQPFPEVGATAGIWEQAASSAPAQLLNMLRTFSHRHEIVQRMPTKAITAMTQAWRADCWKSAFSAGLKSQKRPPSSR